MNNNEIINKDDAIEGIQDYINKVKEKNPKILYGLYFAEETILFDAIYEYLGDIDRLGDYFGVLYVIICRGINSSLMNQTAPTLDDYIKFISSIGSIGYSGEQINKLQELIRAKQRKLEMV